MPAFDFEESSFPLSLGSKQSGIWWQLDDITMKANNIDKDIFMLYCRYIIILIYYQQTPKYLLSTSAYHSS